MRLSNTFAISPARRVAGEHKQRAVHKATAMFADLIEANSFHLPFSIGILASEPGT
jgi:hypothetical protein